MRLQVVVDKNICSLENDKSLEQIIENAFSSYPNLLRIVKLCYRTNEGFFYLPSEVMESILLEWKQLLSLSDSLVLFIYLFIYD